MKTRRGSDTEVGRRMLGSASPAYEAKIKEIRRTLSDIDEELNEHIRELSSQPDNYGYVGDLGHIQSELIGVLRFLRGLGE